MRGSTVRSPLPCRTLCVGCPCRLALVCALLGGLLLAGCGGLGSRPTGPADGPPPQPVDFSSIPDAIPREEPPSRYGNRPSYQVQGETYHTLSASRGYVERGIASWYGTKFHGRPTSSREPYDLYAMTAAHRTLPLPCYVQVRNLENGRSVVVKVNDRGPFHPNRIIDLSYAAAGKLGILGKGTGLVEVRALDPRRPEPVRKAAAPTVGHPSMFIQVGAFADRSNADRLRERIRSSLGQPVRIDESTRPGYRIFRVQIGPLADVDTVDRLNPHLAELGIASTQVVIE